MLWQAVEQMEERLSQFIDSNILDELDTELDGAARFVQHQVVELARDCLAKSVSKHISTSYFLELSDNLEQLLHDVSVVLVFGFYCFTGIISLRIVKLCNSSWVNSLVLLSVLWHYWLKGQPLRSLRTISYLRQTWTCHLGIITAITTTTTTTIGECLWCGYRGTAIVKVHWDCL